MEVTLHLARKDEKRQYEHIIEDKGRRIRRDRPEGGRPEGDRKAGRGAPRRDRREEGQTAERPATTEPTPAA